MEMSLWLKSDIFTFGFKCSLMCNENIKLLLKGKEMLGTLESRPRRGS